MTSKTVKVGATVTAALVVSLLGWEASGRYMNRPQPVIENKTDSQWCAGITGIPKQAYYTDAECDAYTAGHLHRDVTALDRCMPLSLMPLRIQFSARHMAYNTGPVLVCQSTMARHWRAGDYSPASCAAIKRYTFVAGKDCRLTGKRCPGLPLRRDYEWGTCTGAIDWREQHWEYRP